MSTDDKLKAATTEGLAVAIGILQKRAEKYSSWRPGGPLVVPFGDHAVSVQAQNEYASALGHLAGSVHGAAVALQQTLVLHEKNPYSSTCAALAAVPIEQAHLAALEARTGLSPSDAAPEILKRLKPICTEIAQNLDKVYEPYPRTLKAVLEARRRSRKATTNLAVELLDSLPSTPDLANADPELAAMLSELAKTRKHLTELDAFTAEVENRFHDVMCQQAAVQVRFAKDLLDLVTADSSAIFTNKYLAPKLAKEILPLLMKKAADHLFGAGGDALYLAMKALSVVLVDPRLVKGEKKALELYRVQLAIVGNLYVVPFAATTSARLLANIIALTPVSGDNP